MLNTKVLEIIGLPDGLDRTFHSFHLTLSIHENNPSANKIQNVLINLQSKNQILYT